MNREWLLASGGEECEHRSEGGRTREWRGKCRMSSGASVSRRWT